MMFENKMSFIIKFKVINKTDGDNVDNIYIDKYYKHISTSVTWNLLGITYQLQKKGEPYFF